MLLGEFGVPQAPCTNAAESIHLAQQLFPLCLALAGTPDKAGWLEVGKAGQECVRASFSAHSARYLRSFSQGAWLSDAGTLTRVLGGGLH